MKRDRYNFEHSTQSDEAVEAFERVVAAVLAHRPAASDLAAALAADGTMVAALAMKGLALVIMASETSMRLSRELVMPAGDALRQAAGGGTKSERALVAAHALSAHGHLIDAAERLEMHLVTAPTDLLAIKVAHALRFMSGDTATMLATTARVLPCWNSTAPGYGFLLGCHAFSLEETGQFADAEALGRAAVEMVANDVWALHAVTHVLEMRGRLRDGIAWLQPTTGLWAQCGNFGGHLAWHMALFQLSAGHSAGALGVFDRHLQTTATCDFRDMANATSLLWRLEQEGVDVGERWEAVSQIAYDRRRDTAYVFGALHGLLALIGSSRHSAAEDLVEAMKSSALHGATDQDKVAEHVGVELAQTILDMAQQRRSKVPLAKLAARLQRLGGSIAQRDVFLRTLLLIAADSGDEISTARLKDLRLKQRQQDGFLNLVDKRHADGRLRQTLSA